MGHVFSGVFPILPGKSDRVKNFERELEPHRKEWDRLSREGTFRFYNITLQSGPQGDVAIYAFEVEDPTKVRTGFGDSSHDSWWKGYFLDVHGLDLSVVPGPRLRRSSPGRPSDRIIRPHLAATGCRPVLGRRVRIGPNTDLV